MPGPDLTLLTAAARAAGEIAMRWWKQGAQVWDKAEGAGPVTEADLAVNAHLLAVLGAARPGYGWLSEESPDTADRLAAKRVFVIDPIDGTRAFIAGEDTFAHSLAVAEGGRIVAGVVYLPALDRLYAAEAGQGATLNGVPIRASAQPLTDGARVLTTAPNLLPELWPGGVPDIRRSFRTSLAYRMCLVAEGRFDAMLTLRDAWEWDIAAGDLIAREAGALVTDRFGADLRFNAARPQAAGVVAAGPSLHHDLMRRLSPAWPVPRPG